MAMESWWGFNSAMANTERDEGGVYELGDSGKAIIYIGSSGAVKTRLQAHLSGSEGSCTKNASHYRVDYRSDYATEERRRYDEYVRTHGRQPRCNDKRP